jgi:hypothetical protein
MSAIEDNKIIARRWFELINEHKLEEICEITAPTWRMHGGPPKLLPGPDGVRELFRTFASIEQNWTIEDVIAEGDKVVARPIPASRRVSWGYPVVIGGRLHSYVHSEDC